MQSEEPQHVLSIDIGTSGVRCSVFDGDGSEVPALRTVFFSKNDGDPSELAPEILLQLVFGSIDAVARGCESSGINPSFAGVSCFWHSLLGIGDDLRPVTPLLTWADTRAADAGASLRARLNEAEIHRRTGCHVHSSYWPAKLLWLRRSVPDVFQRTARWLSFGDLLHLRLTGECVSSVSMASGTGLFDQRLCNWDDALCRDLEVDVANLPPIAHDGSFSELDSEFKERWPSLSETKWLPAIGDGAANNIGAGCVGANRAAIMIGTSAALRVVFEGDVPDKIPEGLFCYRLDGRRVVLGGALSDGGSLYRWFRDGLGLEAEDAVLEKRLRENPPGYHGLSFLPFVFGERSTGYHADAKGSVIGITRGTDAEDVVIAAMEGMAFRLSEILTRVEEIVRPSQFAISGGAIENSVFLAQMVADILGRDLFRADNELASLKGAALYALEATGAETRLEYESGPAMRVIKFDRKIHEAYKQPKEKHAQFYSRNFRK